LRRGAEGAIPESQSVRGRTQRLAGAERRPARPAPDSGHRRRLRAGGAEHGILDGVIQVAHDDAFKYAVRCVKEEGIFIGISSGASLAAVCQKLPEIPDGSRVLTFCYDTGERYLSVGGLFD
jgi:cysteine synthase A